MTHTTGRTICPGSRNDNLCCKPVEVRDVLWVEVGVEVVVAVDVVVGVGVVVEVGVGVVVGVVVGVGVEVEAAVVIEMLSKSVFSIVFCGDNKLRKRG